VKKERESQIGIDPSEEFKDGNDEAVQLGQYIVVPSESSSSEFIL
jgi:hypothetical protein